MGGQFGGERADCSITFGYPIGPEAIPTAGNGMADHIDGPLYYEKLGKSGPVMAFVHPNPMDQSCWIF